MVWPLWDDMTYGCNIKDGSLVAKGWHDAVVFIMQWSECLAAKDGAWDCNRAVIECLAAKGGTQCARVGSKDIVEWTSTREKQQ